MLSLVRLAGYSKAPSRDCRNNMYKINTYYSIDKSAPASRWAAPAAVVLFTPHVTNRLSCVSDMLLRLDTIAPCLLRVSSFFNKPPEVL